MAEQKNNATCSICGKGYHMCLSCKDQMKLAPWKAHTCSSEHYKVFQVVRGLNTGVYTKEEAKEKLENVDISDIRTFKDNIKKIVKDIMKQDNAVASEKIVEEQQIDKANADAGIVERGMSAVPKIRRKKIVEETE